ncbi:small acid-soluble spore protein Tlp [Neobacillus notoginsengisoli]|uniref:Small, acid-soluble spore protein Tlp n=1 Tax=Neobacillus notoginsengisoli TaxID=1578198 RepID=A0A417YXL7_9BACI|nr:small acid-soluble spore protein Tlp [Neobacillus notoginsengisoli]RHW42145.1 small acid-soluble spore protein Tlp [Neobacillus notoginsengisoli]
MADQTTPKPDDRSDNVEKLQEMIHNTIENMERAEETLALSDSDETKRQVEEKNARRRESIEAMRMEVKDEARYQGQD